MVRSIEFFGRDAIWLGRAARWSLDRYFAQCGVRRDADVAPSEMAAETRYRIHQQLSHGVDELGLVYSSADFARMIRSGALPRIDAVRTWTTLTHYYQRCTTRAVPFGLFAGIFVGRFGASTCIELDSQWLRGTVCDVDGEEVASLIGRALGDGACIGELWVALNQTLAIDGAHGRYIRAKYEGERLQMAECEFALDDNLRCVLEMLMQPEQIGTLRDGLRDARGITDVEDLNRYVRELVDSGLLIVVDGSAVVGGTSAISLVERLAKYPEAPAGRSAISIERQLISGAPDVDRGGRSVLTATALVAATCAQVAKSDLKYIDSSVNVLRRLSDWGAKDEFVAFRAAFRERYECGFYPLVGVLDDRTGIGVPPLGDGSEPERSSAVEEWAYPELSAQTECRYSAAAAQWLGGLVATALSSGVDEIDIGDRIHGLNRCEAAVLPASMGAMVSVYAGVGQGAEPQIGLKLLGGPSALRTLGRFLHCEPRLAELAQEIVAHEQSAYGDALLAEIEYRAGPRLANIHRHSSPYEHWIDVSGCRHPDAGRIALSDLYVGIVGDTVVLWSESRGRRIIPRLTCAHNYMMPDNSPIYKFLCLLQNQSGCGWLSWTWGPFESMPRLPRVRLGNVILARQKWHIEDQHIQQMRGRTDKDLASEWGRLRTLYGLPRFVRYGPNDMELLYDLANVHYGRQLVHDWKPHLSQSLYEEIDMVLGGSVVRTKSERFHHELLIPVKSPAPPADAVNNVSAHLCDERARIELRALALRKWEYLRIYAAPRVLDDLVTGELGDMMVALRNVGHVDRWFFVRYKDSATHLRLRWAPAAESHRYTARHQVERLLGECVKRGDVWKIESGQYVQEFARYGGVECIDAAEAVFSADSEFVLDVRRKLGRCDDDDLIAVAVATAGRIRGALVGHEIGATRDLGELVGARTRGGSRSAAVAGGVRALKSLGWPKCSWAEYVGTCGERYGADLFGGWCWVTCERALGHFIATVRNVGKVPTDDVAAAIVHMHLNRMLDRGHARREPVILGILCGLLSNDARARGRK